MFNNLIQQINKYVISFELLWNVGTKDVSDKASASAIDVEMSEMKENGITGDTHENPTDALVAEEEVVNEQELKYWKAVKENPADFTSWTYLLQFVEQEVCLQAAVWLTFSCKSCTMQVLEVKPIYTMFS